MKSLHTLPRKRPFQYEGSMKEGITLYYGTGRRTTIKQSESTALLHHFQGRTVPIGKSRDNPQPDSLGEWLMSNVTKTAIASYVAPILVEEGYADWVGTAELSFHMSESVDKQYLDLMQIFEGYVRNYRRMNLSFIHNRSMFTSREIDYFAKLGEMLGYDTLMEDYKKDLLKGRSRPMDLAWWKYDARVYKEDYLHLALHLERENMWSKDEETIEKLFSKTEEGYVPHNVIGIQNIESSERIHLLNELVCKKNKQQQSNVLMVYRYLDKEHIERVSAHTFSHTGEHSTRETVCKQDETGYWFMIFNEEREVR